MVNKTIYISILVVLVLLLISGCVCGSSKSETLKTPSGECIGTSEFPYLKTNLAFKNGKYVPTSSINRTEQYAGECFKIPANWVKHQVTPFTNKLEIRKLCKENNCPEIFLGEISSEAHNQFYFDNIKDCKKHYKHYKEGNPCYTVKTAGFPSISIPHCKALESKGSTKKQGTVWVNGVNKVSPLLGFAHLPTCVRTQVKTITSY